VFSSLHNTSQSPVVVWQDEDLAMSLVRPALLVEDSLKWLITSSFSASSPDIFQDSPVPHPWYHAYEKQDHCHEEDRRMGGNGSNVEAFPGSWKKRTDRLIEMKDPVNEQKHL